MSEANQWLCWELPPLLEVREGVRLDALRKRLECSGSPARVGCSLGDGIHRGCDTLFCGVNDHSVTHTHTLRERGKCVGTKWEGNVVLSLHKARKTCHHCGVMCVHALVFVCCLK